MRKLKALAAITLAIIGAGTTAASAQALTRDQAAWRDMTNTCLQYQGCRNLTLYHVTTFPENNGACKQYYYFFDTRYVGRKYYTTGAYCSPPYSR